MRIGWLIAAMLLAPGACRATIIFVTLAPDAIYVGADSRVTLIDDTGHEARGPDSCKVRMFGNIVVANSGITTDASTGFDVWSVLGTIKAASVADFTEQIKKLLPERLQAVYAARSRRTGKAAVNVLAADIGVMAYEGGKSAFIWIVFYMDNGVVKAALHDDGKGFKNDGTFSTLPIGEGGAISFDDFTNLGCATFPIDPVANIRCYLAAYIKADPIHINVPISILKVTSKTTEWVEPGACEKTNH